MSRTPCKKSQWYNYYTLSPHNGHLSATATFFCPQGSHFPRVSALSLTPREKKETERRQRGCPQGGHSAGVVERCYCTFSCHLLSAISNSCCRKLFFISLEGSICGIQQCYNYFYKQVVDQFKNKMYLYKY